jgi:hypothetical protein
MVASSTTRDPRTRIHTLRATWIFGLLIVLFLIYVFLKVPDGLPEFKQRILAVLCALLCGLFTFFLMGDIALRVDAHHSPVGKISVRASSGAAVFVLVLLWWLSPLSPVKTVKPIVRQQSVGSVNQNSSGAGANNDAAVQGDITIHAEKPDSTPPKDNPKADK